MKAVLQRVKEAHVDVGGKTVGAIGRGLLVFLAVGKGDTQKEADVLVKKIVELRIFEDTEGKMNIAAPQAGAAVLVVPQFTLYGDCSNGRRPSFDQAADPRTAEVLYQYFIGQLKKTNVNVESGQFRAMMDVHLVNDGPVTFILEN
jgi:D-tyrosyl-tRNA(Tyr) deacylase